jgi:4-hydroxy-4-methyl-2-oxoglutarate aldolase
MNSEIWQTLSRLSCTHLSDAMDRLGIAGQCAGLMPLDRGFRMVGQAWTLRYGPVGQDVGTVGDYIDDIEAGIVVALDNGGRTDVTVWGDLLTYTASRRSVAGTAIDGVCRDLDRALELKYPIFSRGNWMRTGKDRVRVEAIQVPISLGGIRVEPGDWICGDIDGLVSIPNRRVNDVIAAALEVNDAECKILAAVESGASLRKARHHFGYHRLQTRR